MKIKPMKEVGDNELRRRVVQVIRTRNAIAANAKQVLDDDATRERYNALEEVTAILLGRRPRTCSTMGKNPVQDALIDSGFSYFTADMNQFTQAIDMEATKQALERATEGSNGDGVGAGETDTAEQA